jgi:hypothetical protein
MKGGKENQGEINEVPHTFLFHHNNLQLPIPAAALSKAWFYGRSLAGIADSNPAGVMEVCLLC